ncbi:hypothetical protein EGW08_021066, partial [Elysia chlorotica]
LSLTLLLLPSTPILSLTLLLLPSTPILSLTLLLLPSTPILSLTLLLLPSTPILSLTLLFAVPPDTVPLARTALRLACSSTSNSLPVGHGLPLKFWWRDGQGSYISQGSKFYMNSAGELQVDELSRADAGLKFACVAADDTEGSSTGFVQSLESNYYTVSPEYAPSQSDLKISPHVDNGAIVSKDIGGDLRYECTADCNPPCEIKWMYKSGINGSMYGEVQRSGVLDKKGLSRLDPGKYRCRAQNEHNRKDPVKTTFTLDLLYLEVPQVFMRGQPISNASIYEQEDSIELKCVFDSNPRPLITWRSPSGEELLSEEGEGPQEGLDPDTRVWESLYTSRLNMASLRCEDSGVYSCLGNADNKQVEGRMNVNVKCVPKPANIPGLDLQEEYVWLMSEPLQVKFVMRGWPAPKITRIWSSLDGVQRNEILDTDVAVRRIQPYDGKAWLTYFEITSKRSLTKADTDRVYTMNLFSPDVEKTYSFRIRSRGPPDAPLNVTAENVGHDSVEVFWLPGFNGGDDQVFSIEYRKTGKDGQATSDWAVAAKDIPEVQGLTWQTSKISGLQPSTGYAVRVRASNVLGTSVAELSVKTMSVPSSGGLGAGAVVGIVFAVIVFLVIVVFLLYWFVYRKKYGAKGLKDFR